MNIDRLIELMPVMHQLGIQNQHEVEHFARLIEPDIGLSNEQAAEFIGYSRVLNVLGGLMNELHRYAVERKIAAAAEALAALNVVFAYVEDQGDAIQELAKAEILESQGDKDAIRAGRQRAVDEALAAVEFVNANPVVTDDPPAQRVMLGDVDIADQIRAAVGPN